MRLPGGYWRNARSKQRVITNLGCKNPFGPHLGLAAFGIGNDGAHDDQ
jgi:hypothetical protein